MHAFLISLLCIAAAYAAGCLNTGYYLVRVLRGEDIRTRHSGSTGARNTARSLGKAGFAAVFAGDAGKAALVLFGARYGIETGMPGLDARILPWLIPAVVAGHIWPAQLGFKGGKGLSAAAGAFLVIDYRVVAGFLATHYLVGYLARSKRVGLLASLLVIPPLAFFCAGSAWFPASSLLTLLLAIAHRDNLRDLPPRGARGDSREAQATNIPEECA
jgi:glycerol-3-phosphate acyltransferase PlsY